MVATPTLPLASLVTVRRLLFVAAPVLFGLLALNLGMDADWDLRNYHYYNAWALLTGRQGWDMLAAQRPSFYDPVLDIPFFLLAQGLPARVVAFLLGAVHGVNVILLTLLGERLIVAHGPWRRFGLSALLAVAGACGSIALSEVGTVFYDNVLSLGLFASLLLILVHWDRLKGQLTLRNAALAAMDGLPAGLAFGLKQTAVMFPVGLAVALLITLPAPIPRRVAVTFWFGVGVLAATLAGGGYWMLHLWHLYGNPVFPHFNQLFHSPWALPQSYRDVQYEAGTLWRRIFFPVVFSLDSRQAGEIVFRDYRVLTAFILIPLAGLTRVVQALWAPRSAPGGTPGFVNTQHALFVMVTAAAAYGVWLEMFAVYRYLTALEMLAPLLIVLAVGLMPGPRLWRLEIALALVAFLVLTTRPGEWIRVPFSEKAVEVQVPTIADPAHTIVLLAGHEPLSFLLPAFPPQMRFLRVDSNFTNPDETGVRFNQVMRQIVAEHQGPLLALFIPTERHDVVRRIGQYGLKVETSGCAQVTSPIGAAPYALCPVTRKP
jgi:hypothetical protein